MEIGSTTNPSLRAFPSRRALLLVVVLSIFAVGAFLSYGFASFASTTSSTSTSNDNSSSGTASSTHSCPGMMDSTGASNSGTSSTSTG